MTEVGKDRVRRTCAEATVTYLCLDVYSSELPTREIHIMRKPLPVHKFFLEFFCMIEFRSSFNKYLASSYTMKERLGASPVVWIIFIQNDSVQQNIKGIQLHSIATFRLSLQPTPNCFPNPLLYEHKLLMKCQM